jgi:hypothetical protein
LQPVENEFEFYAGPKAFIERYNYKRHQGIKRPISADVFKNIA